MAKDYKFSISVYIDNEELLPATIASITADKEFFRNSIQIVLIDSLVTKESTELNTPMITPKIYILLIAKAKIWQNALAMQELYAQELM